MRVAFATPTFFADESHMGGGERYPLNVARGVLSADERVQVDLIAIGTAPRVIHLQPRLDLHILPVTLPGADLFDHVSDALLDLLAEADVVHVHQAFTRSSQVAILAAKFLGKPVVVTDHGGPGSPIAQEVGYLELVDLLVFYSRFGAGLIHGGRRRVVIPGGVDDDFFHPAAEPVAREFVLFVGRLLAHKGIDRLLSALPRDLPCVVVGRAYDVRYAAYLRALAGGRDVRFTETADDVELRELYRRAWATVLPSVHRDTWGRVYQAPELMGLTALESMACGTPALVSTAGALPEFVRDGETGFVFSGLEELRELTGALAGGRIDPDALGRRGREVVTSTYSLELVGEQLHREYRQLAEA